MNKLLLVLCLPALSADCAPVQRVQGTTPLVTVAGSPQALAAQAEALAARGDGSRAEQYLMLAVRLGYPEARAIGPLVRVCIAASRLRAALDHAEPFLRRHPQSWQLRYLVAAIRFALGDPLEAAQQLRRVLAQRPETVQAHYLLAVIARDAAHDEAAARDNFQAYLEHDPQGRFALEAEAWLSEHPHTPAGAVAPNAKVTP